MILVLLLALMLVGLAVALGIRATSGRSELEARNTRAGCRLWVRAGSGAGGTTGELAPIGRDRHSDRSAPDPAIHRLSKLERFGSC